MNVLDFGLYINGPKVVQYFSDNYMLRVLRLYIFRVK